MSPRQPVRITYAHKRKRAKAVNRIQSSPLEILPPEKDDITRSEMKRRMLKRSRRAALAEQNDDKNVERALLRDRLAKRIRRTEEYAMSAITERSAEPLEAPFLQDESSFQTPFPTSEYMHESTVARPLVPENLSPVPVVRRILPRTSSRNLKENNEHSYTLSSPFHSRPGSATSSPQKRAKKSIRASRISLRGVSRSLSRVLKENSRRISRKDSTISLNEINKHSPAKVKMHQRYPSSPSTSYMRSQMSQEDWLARPSSSSRTIDDREISPRESIRSMSSFLNGMPQFCSTPLQSRLKRRVDPQAILDDNGSSACMLPSGVHNTDAQMTDDIHPRRQKIRISPNSIFSSSGEISLVSPPCADTADVNSIFQSSGHSKPRNRGFPVAGDPSEVEITSTTRNLARAFIGEYTIPLRAAEADSFNRVPSGSPCIQKVSVGNETLVLPSTSSPAPDFGPGVSNASPVRGRSSLTPPSPSADLIRDMSSLDICAGDAEVHSDEEAPRGTSTHVLQNRSHSLDNPAIITSAKVASNRKSGRDRAGTIRASDFARPNPSMPPMFRGPTVADPSKAISGARRTRSGTVVGPNSKLANEPAPTCKPATLAKIPASQLASESESDDEMLLKGIWIEDFEYLGLPAPEGCKHAEGDELNMDSLWDGEERSPPRRPGLRRC